METAITDLRAYLDEMVQIVSRYSAEDRNRDSAVTWDTSDAAIERYQKWCKAHDYDQTNKYHFWHYWGIPDPLVGDEFKRTEDFVLRSSLEIFGPWRVSPEQLETHGFSLDIAGGKFYQCDGTIRNEISVTDKIRSPLDRYQISIPLEFETFSVAVEQSIIFPVTEHPIRGEYRKYSERYSRFSFIASLDILATPFGHTFGGELMLTSNGWEGLRETLQSLYLIKYRGSNAIRNHELVEERIRKSFLQFPSKDIRKNSVRV